MTTMEAALSRMRAYHTFLVKAGRTLEARAVARCITLAREAQEGA